MKRIQLSYRLITASCFLIFLSLGSNGFSCMKPVVDPVCTISISSNVVLSQIEKLDLCEVELKIGTVGGFGATQNGTCSVGFGTLSNLFKLDSISCEFKDQAGNSFIHFQPFTNDPNTASAWDQAFPNPDLDWVGSKATVLNSFPSGGVFDLFMTLHFSPSQCPEDVVDLVAFLQESYFGVGEYDPQTMMLDPNHRAQRQFNYIDVQFGCGICLPSSPGVTTKIQENAAGDAEKLFYSTFSRVNPQDTLVLIVLIGTDTFHVDTSYGINMQNTIVLPPNTDPNDIQVIHNIFMFCDFPNISYQSPIESCLLPEAGFGFNTNGLQVAFNDLSLSANGVLAWLWDFGGGNQDIVPNPIHVFPGPGVYNVCLTIEDDCGESQKCMDVMVVCPPPQPAFNYMANSLQVDFMDQSSTFGVSTTLLWDFGDGTQSSFPNPTHTYQNPGTYKVCLSLDNSCATRDTCKYISVNCPSPTASFSYSIFDSIVTFTNQSTTSPPSASFFWDFGDGSTSSDENPTHSYPTYSPYVVTLIVIDSCGQDTFTTTISLVSTLSPTPPHDVSVTVFPTPSDQILKINIASSEPTSYSLSLHDVLGRMLIERIENKILSKTIELDVSEIPPGTYFIRVSSESRQFTRKVTVMR